MTKPANYIACSIVATALMLLTVVLASCSDEHLPTIEDQAPTIVDAPDSAELASPIAEISPAEAWEAAQPALAQAEEASKKLIEERLSPARKLFEAASSQVGLEAFVDDILSYGSKLKRLSGEEQFNRHVAESFQEKVLSEQQLTKLFENIAATYQTDLDACDSQLLLTLQADADTAPAQAIDAAKFLPPVRQNFSELYRASQVVAGDDVVVEVLRQGTSLIVGQFLSTAIANRATNNDSAGDGLGKTGLIELAGLAIGFALDHVIDQVTSPKDDLVKKLRRSLGELRDRSIPALRGCLQNMASERAAARRQVISQAYGVAQ